MSILERFIVNQSPVVREGLFKVIGCSGSRFSTSIRILNEKDKVEDIKLCRPYNAKNVLELVGKEVYLTQYDGCYPIYEIKIK